MSTNLRIDGARLTSRLAELSKIGATPEGGCRRLALTDEDRQGRDWLVAQMKALGLDTRVDAIGNIVGILKGLEDGPAVIMGSHIDTVGTWGSDYEKLVFTSDGGGAVPEPASWALLITGFALVGAAARRRRAIATA